MGGVVKSVGKAVAAPFKAVNQVVKAVPVIGPAIDRGLVSLDKAVGKSIPGGWNTLAQTALAFTPLGLPAKVGLAALGGSGAFGPNGKFNFQRALLSGALAYGANQLAQGLETAGGGTPNSMISGADVAAANLADDPIAALNASQGFTGVGGAEGAQLLNTVPPSATSEFATKTMNNLAAAGQGIKNLTGFGTGAAEAASKFTGPVTTGGITALGVGTMGLMSLDEQEKLLNEQYQQGAVNDSEYQRQMAIIADGRRRAEEAVRANPYQFAEGGEVPGYAFGGVAGIIQKMQSEGGLLDRIKNSIRGQTAAPSPEAAKTELANVGIRQNIIERADPTQLQNYLNAMRKGEDERSAYRALINNPYGFANGGSIDDSYGYDDAMGSRVGNMDQGLFAPSRYAAGGLAAFNQGGQPRFLSGGGDGMSDSIPATIGENRPARLADGEFVIPADVVSNLGNGSSKAGAKRLYGMMDRVRKARTGTTKQARAINAAKVMPA